MKKLIILTSLILFIFTTSLFAEMGRVTVTGEGSKEVLADNFTLSFSLTLRHPTKKEVNQFFTKEHSDLVAALKKIDISTQDLVTDNLFLSPWSEWQNNRSVLKGYQITQNFSIETSNHKLMSDLISALSEFKNITVYNLSQSLKKESKQKHMDDLYALAFENGYTKIRAILKAANQTLISIESIEEIEAMRPQMMGMLKSMGVREDSRDSGAQIEFTPTKMELKTELRIKANYKI